MKEILTNKSTFIKVNKDGEEERIIKELIADINSCVSDKNKIQGIKIITPTLI